MAKTTKEKTSDTIIDVAGTPVNISKMKDGEVKVVGKTEVKKFRGGYTIGTTNKKD